MPWDKSGENGEGPVSRAAQLQESLGDSNQSTEPEVYSNSVICSVDTLTKETAKLVEGEGSMMETVVRLNTVPDPSAVTPMLNAANSQAEAAEAEVKRLLLAAQHLKSQGFTCQPKYRKSVKLSMDVCNSKELADYLKSLKEAASKKEGSRSGYVQAPALPKVSVKLCNVIRNDNSSLSARRLQMMKPGIDMLICEGSFAVPSTYSSGNCYVDEMNLVLFEIYMAVHDLLQAAQAASTFVQLGLECDRDNKVEDDRRAAVRKLRSSGYGIRSSIRSVEGIPLREPVLYWREAFPDVVF